jgi:hypothetical protein
MTRSESRRPEGRVGRRARGPSPTSSVRGQALRRGVRPPATRRCPVDRRSTGRGRAPSSRLHCASICAPYASWTLGAFRPDSHRRARDGRIHSGGRARGSARDATRRSSPPSASRGPVQRASPSPTPRRPSQRRGRPSTTRLEHRRRPGTTSRFPSCRTRGRGQTGRDPGRTPRGEAAPRPPRCGSPSRRRGRRPSGRRRRPICDVGVAATRVLRSSRHAQCSPRSTARSLELPS